MLGIEVQAAAEEIDGGLEVLPVPVTAGLRLMAMILLLSPSAAPLVNPGMEEGLELAGIEMTPHPGLGRVPTSQLAATGRTAPADAGSMLNVHTASGRIQLDVGNKPRVAQPQNPRIQVRVLHGRPPGLTITGHLPTENPEGPFYQVNGQDGGPGFLSLPER